MRILLDTHVAIWSVSSSKRISGPVAVLLTDPDNEVFVSSASIFEIAIKYQSGKRDKPPFSAHDAIRLFDQSGYQRLPVSAVHAAKVETLPSVHGDPFDRLLVAQSICEAMTLVTYDRTLVGYGDMIMLF